MAFSNTVSQTVFTNQQVYDHAFRLAKIPPQKITREYLQTARDLLYMILSTLANKGLVLWSIGTHILPMYYGKQTVPCPAGTVDILNANLRQVERLDGTATSSEGTAENAFDGDIDTACVQIAAAGWIQLQFTEATQMTNFGILPGSSGAWDFEVQVSDDGSTWLTVYTAIGEALTNGEWFWFDVEGIPEAVYVRLKANNLTVLDVREFVVANSPLEIPVAKINRDDYMNLPNKTFLGRPTEFYYDKQIATPNMVLWPAPEAEYTFWQLTITTQRYVMDPGTMQQQIEIPQGWYLAIVTDLAYNLALEIPESPAGRDLELLPVRDLRMSDAWASQSDGAPVRITPNISPYTR